ncbi:histidine phosphatase family protein [Streptococcus entericus]|uniref:histidine phosphatase family protein n=1 Tax=Streptococcus entericus TaxID=155680 RepID=UPI0003786A8B|nr:histidine phosphatase family protein [Streptococcus entericus]
MTETRLYIVRHGKTMFNTLGRAQGWCDSPLTTLGREGIRELGQGFAVDGLTFDEAFSSDSGRTLETLAIVLKELGQESLPHTADRRIREWCFGSLEGLYDEELFHGVLPRTSVVGLDKKLTDLTYQEIAEALVEADTAGWAEPWEVLRDRIWQGFVSIAERLETKGGGNGLVVCHGMTIATLLWLIDPWWEKTMIDNGSVTVLSYEKGQFSIEQVADLSYRYKGREALANEKK